MMHVWKVLLHGAKLRAAWITSAEEDNKHLCLQAFQSGGPLEVKFGKVAVFWAAPSFSMCLREKADGKIRMWVTVFIFVRISLCTTGVKDAWICNKLYAVVWLCSGCPSMGPHGRANPPYEQIQTQSTKWAAVEWLKLLKCRLPGSLNASKRIGWSTQLMGAGLKFSVILTGSLEVVDRLFMSSYLFVCTKGKKICLSMFFFERQTRGLIRLLKSWKDTQWYL